MNINLLDIVFDLTVESYAYVSHQVLLGVV